MSNYTFNASALAVGGFFTYNGEPVLVDSRASVALAPDGGSGYARETNYRSPHVSFYCAESSVSGWETSPNYYVTKSAVKIAGLEILNRFRVGLLEVEVTSTRDLTEGNSEATFTIEASFNGVEFESGHICPELDVNLCASSSYEDLAQRELAALQAVSGGEDDAYLVRRDELLKGAPIRSSVVHNVVHPRGQGELRRRNVVRIPDFADVHFGELVVKRGRRRVNLIRFDFGMMDDLVSPFGNGVAFANGIAPAALMNSGSLTIASGDGNGEPIWPRG